MGRTRQGTPPSYPSRPYRGQARITVRLIDGSRKDYLLGPHGSAESWAEYRRLLAELQAHGGRLPIHSTDGAADLSVNELIVAYFKHVEGYYVKNGKPTSEQDTIRQALRFVKLLYGHTPAKEFGPLCLKAIRAEMVRHPIVRKHKVIDPETGKVRWEEKVERVGLARRYVNKQISRVKRMVAWAVESELLSVTVHQALCCVKGLAKGKGLAREKGRVRPVAEAHVEAVSPPVRTMIEVQRLCGCRPQDIVGIRAIDIDMTGPVWEYRPPHYKTEHLNDEDDPDRERIIFLGPRAQELLRTYLTLNVTDYLFSPARAEAQRQERRREQRQTPLWESHVRHQQKKRSKRRRASWADRYDVASYRRAIRRACLKAGIPVWSPVQLRHAAGTEVRKRYGLEASQAVLGHRELGVTQIYAEVDRDAARRVMAEIG